MPVLPLPLFGQCQCQRSLRECRGQYGRRYPWQCTATTFLSPGSTRDVRPGGVYQTWRQMGERTSVEPRGRGFTELHYAAEPRDWNHHTTSEPGAGCCERRQTVPLWSQNETCCTWL